MAFAAPLLPLLPSILGVAGAGLAAVNSVQQGNYQAAVARNNAAIAQQNSNLESERAQVEASRSDREYSALLGEQLAAQGASGLDILGRSQMQTRNATRRVRGEAAGDIRTEGVGTSRRLLQDAENFKSEASNARKQGIIGAVGAGLQGVSGFASDMGWTSSLATTRSKAGRRPWDRKPNWSGGS